MIGFLPCFRALSCAALLLVGLVGCVAHDGPPELGQPLPGRFREADRSQQAAVDPSWWQGLGSRELDRLVEAGLSGNLDLAIAKARLQQAEAQIVTARAPLFPQVSGSGSASQQRVELSSATNNQFGLTLSGSWLIDVFGKTRASLDGFQNAALAAEANRDFAALTMAAAISNTYLQMCAYQDRLVIAERNIATATRVLNAIRARARVGTASELEVAQQETLLYSQRAQVPALQQQASVARNALAVLVGQAPEAFAAKGMPLSAIKLPVPKPGLPSDLLQRRPDVKAAEYTLAQMDANVRSARAAFFPSISLTGSAGYSSNALETLIRPESVVTSIAASVVQTVFDGGTLVGQKKLADGKQVEALQNYRKTVITAFADVENALVAVRSSSQQLRHLRAAETAAARAFRLVDERLNAGTVDIVTLLNTQQSLIQAQDSRVQTHLTRASASVSLYQALGGGWSSERPVVIAADEAAQREVAP